MYLLSAFVKLCMEEGVISMIFFLYLDVICLSKVDCVSGGFHITKTLVLSQTETLHMVAPASLAISWNISLLN